MVHIPLESQLGVQSLVSSVKIAKGQAGGHSRDKSQQVHDLGGPQLLEDTEIEAPNLYAS